MLIAIVATIPAAALIVWHGAEDRREAAARLTGLVVNHAELAKAAHDGAVESARKLLVGLAQLEVVEQFHFPACDTAMRKVVRAIEVYELIAVADVKGDVLCASADLSRPVNIGDRAYFRRALATRSFAVGEYLVGRMTGQSVLGVAAPIMDGAGQVRGVIFAGISLRWLERLSTTTLPPGSTITVVHNDGRVLTRFPDPGRWGGASAQDAPLIRAILSSGQGSVTTPGLDGQVRVYGFTRLGADAGPLHELFLAVGVPASELLQDARRTLFYAVAIVAVAGITMSALLLAGIDRWVLHHVRRLLTVTSRMTDGDLSARVGHPRPPAELGVLAQAFDEMASRLETRYREAHAAREELRAANETLRAVIEAPPVGIVVLDAEGCVRMWSRGAREIFGWQEDEVLGRRNPAVPGDARAESESRSPDIAG